jgi:hypothetical protein
MDDPVALADGTDTAKPGQFADDEVVARGSSGTRLIWM